MPRIQRSWLTEPLLRSKGVLYRNFTVELQQVIMHSVVVFMKWCTDGLNLFNIVNNLSVYIDIDKRQEINLFHRYSFTRKLYLSRNIYQRTLRYKCLAVGSWSTSIISLSSRFQILIAEMCSLIERLSALVISAYLSSINWNFADGLKEIYSWIELNERSNVS